MNEDAFRQLLQERADAAEISLNPIVADGLASYFKLLAHWNTRINLTSVSLAPPTAQSVDRLFIEPLLAASLVKPSLSIWFDLGSGGGSPAIPLQLAHGARRLIMVESKERKAAFLREAIRAIPIVGAEVEVSRIEEVAAYERNAGIADLVTIRAVRLDASLFSWVQTLLRFGGQAILFGAQTISHLPRGLELTNAIGTAARGLVALRRSGL
jgi:16S rRNA (guanine(527)-N(7))-methyltransferase RsmG